MAYKVRYPPGARRQFLKLPEEARRRLGPKIEALATDPRPPGVKKLAGRPDLWRIRAGDWRAIYLIEDEILLMVKLAHRREALD